MSFAVNTALRVLFYLSEGFPRHRRENVFKASYIFRATPDRLHNNLRLWPLGWFVWRGG